MAKSTYLKIMILFLKVSNSRFGIPSTLVKIWQYLTLTSQANKIVITSRFTLTSLQSSQFLVSFKMTIIHTSTWLIFHMLNLIVKDKWMIYSIKVIRSHLLIIRNHKLMCVDQFRKGFSSEILETRTRDDLRRL